MGNFVCNEQNRTETEEKGIWPFPLVLKVTDDALRRFGLVGRLSLYLNVKIRLIILRHG